MKLWNPYLEKASSVAVKQIRAAVGIFISFLAAAVIMAIVIGVTFAAGAVFSLIGTAIVILIGIFLIAGGISESFAEKEKEKGD